METSKRARRRKSDTAKADLKPPLAVSGGQGVHREMESEGHEEKFRAVIKGSPSDEPVGQRWVRSFGRARTMRAKAFSFTHRTKVIADGTERKNSA
jgi:hypothetical protein